MENRDAYPITVFEIQTNETFPLPAPQPLPLRL